MSASVLPLLHSNGTSKTELIRQHLDAIRALDATLDALQAAAPNGRDYYLHREPDAFVVAQAQHLDRISRARALRAEIEEIAVAIAAGGHHNESRGL